MTTNHKACNTYTVHPSRNVIPTRYISKPWKLATAQSLIQLITRKYHQGLYNPLSCRGVSYQDRWICWFAIIFHSSVVWPAILILYLYHNYQPLDKQCLNLTLKIFATQRVVEETTFSFPTSCLSSCRFIIKKHKIFGRHTSLRKVKL